MYDINDLFLATVNKEVTIISYSQYADLIHERKLKAEDDIENILPLYDFYEDANYLSIDAIQILYDLVKTSYFNVITDGSKKMHIKQ